jgi:hypothetical protein
VGRGGVGGSDSLDFAQHSSKVLGAGLGEGLLGREKEVLARKEVVRRRVVGCIVVGG